MLLRAAGALRVVPGRRGFFNLFKPRRTIADAKESIDAEYELGDELGVGKLECDETNVPRPPFLRGWWEGHAWQRSTSDLLAVARVRWLAPRPCCPPMFLPSFCGPGTDDTHTTPPPRFRYGAALLSLRVSLCGTLSHE